VCVRACARARFRAWRVEVCLHDGGGCRSKQGQGLGYERPSQFSVFYVGAWRAWVSYRGLNRCGFCSGISLCWWWYCLGVGAP
jgi:hypothetical protein